MDDSVSERSFYFDSEEDEEAKKFLNEDNRDDDDDDDGNVSESSNDSVENLHQTKYGSSSAWPQSYRQSIDLYTSIPSPSLGFLGTPSLSRLGSSFLSGSSNLIKRHTPEIPSSLTKPFLPTTGDEYRPQHQTFLPPTQGRRSSLFNRDQYKSSRVSHELPISRQCSFGQAVINAMNVLCGVGILSTPYAAKEGGWAGLSILLLFALLSFYTGILLRDCLDSAPELETYPDVGQAAFGPAGRIAISVILYVELYVCCVEYIILESDNLSSLFPNANLSLAGFYLNSHHLFALIATMVILPTVWIRNLSVLSYISAGGVIASLLAIICLFWVGLVDNVSFHPERTTTLNLSTLPVAIGLYGFCYSGHAVLPNIYTSLKNPSQFPLVLFTSFALCTMMYAGVSVIGYLMFGEFTKSEFTLNMPQNLTASKFAVWTTVVNPFTKYALSMMPLSLSIEELIPSKKSHGFSILIRSALVISTLLVGISIPFFGLVMALVGSLFTMLISLILPCACYLSILKGRVPAFKGLVCVLIIAVGLVSSTFGTYSALCKIIESLRT